MFGRRDRFDYWECAACGCVQIMEFPANISDLYPENYYSFQVPAMSPQPGNSPLRNLVSVIKRRLVRIGGIRKLFLQSASTRRFLRTRPVAAQYLSRVPDPATRILDVGCGTGELLRSLDVLHYRNITGIDPFIGQDIYLRGRLLVRKMNLSELNGQFDVISLHHVLEHIENQVDILKNVKRLLAPDGMVIIRIPVAGTAAWKQYRQDWVQLDPPRHFFLHTDRSFRLLVAAAELMVETIDYDSTGLQFWGSELYLRDTPLIAADGRTTPAGRYIQRGGAGGVRAAGHGVERSA